MLFVRHLVSDILCFCLSWLIPPRPYGNNHGNICGYNLGFFQIDCGSFLCPIARTFPPSSRCLAAIAFNVSISVDSYCSPVRVCTVKGHLPTSVPFSNSVSCTLVASGILFVTECR